MRLEGSDAQRIGDALRVKDGLRLLIKHLLTDKPCVLGLALDLLNMIVILSLQCKDTLAQTSFVGPGMSIWVRAARRRRIGRAQ